MTSDDHTVLILEDEFLIGEDIQELVRSLGLRALLLTRVAEAIRLIEDGLVTFAVLDHLISGQSTLVVAQALRDRGIPFVLCSGSDLSDLEAVFGSVAVVTKPYQATFFQNVIKKEMSGLYPRLRFLT